MTATDAQVRIAMRERKKGKNQEQAAAKANLRSRKTIRKYEKLEHLSLISRKRKGTKVNFPIAYKLVLTRQAKSEFVLINQKVGSIANTIDHQAFERQHEKFQHG